MTSVDVCITGGGPAGLATAHAILRASPHTRVAVMERSDLRPRGAWFGLAPNGVRALAAISPELHDAVARHDTRHLVQRRYTPAGELTSSVTDGSAASPVLKHGKMFSLQWHALQRTLAEALPKGVLHTHSRFVRYEETADSVVAEFDTPQGPRRVSARLLLGCDGGQSLVREQMLADGPPQYLGMAIWRAVRPKPADWLVEHGHVAWAAVGQASLVTYTFAEGHGMLCWQAFAPWPAERLAEIGGGRRAYISQEADPAEAAQLGQASPEDAARQRLARAQSMFGGHPQCVQDLIASTDPAAITEHGQFHRDADSCRTYAQGRVALVGDAAHLATPFLGQGCSQALEDALEAGRAIGAHGPTPEALAAYQAVRLPLAGAVQKESVQLCKDFHGGKMDRHEYDVNIGCGFVQRTFEPLVPTA